MDQTVSNPGSRRFIRLNITDAAQEESLPLRADGRGFASVWAQSGMLEVCEATALSESIRFPRKGTPEFLPTAFPASSEVSPERFGYGVHLFDGGERPDEERRPGDSPGGDWPVRPLWP